ncbi:MAG: SpoIVB peptidase [Lachnospiraceae bacterium]|nr:SpoIVB peptidase [Lachnospiraceae bacterium]
MNQRMLRYRNALRYLLCLGILAIPLYSYYDIYTRVPEVIRLRAGQEESLDFQVPVSGEVYRKSAGNGINLSTERTGERSAETSVNTSPGTSIDMSAVPVTSVHIQLDKPVRIKPVEADTYEMNLRILGVIPLKNVNLEVVRDQKVIPAGIPIGIYVKTEGVLVIDTGKFKDDKGDWQEPSQYVLNSGDYIERVNQMAVTNKKEFVSQIAECEGEELVLDVLRQNEKIQVKLKPEKNENGEYKAGIWVRDSAQGIGTLTYLSEENEFGALGHGITDIDTSELMEVEGGTLYTTQIMDVLPGKSGTPGELTGMIQYQDDNILGEIQRNTAKGIFGKGTDNLTEYIHHTPVPVGLKQDIELGPAQIICTLDHDTKIYDVEIKKLDYAREDTNRGIILQVTDEELLSRTGGIIQGMSGAPILQNGKLIGAVTHVLVQDPTMGYGIFIETMME